jgi:hypothetical protein
VKHDGCHWQQDLLDADLRAREEIPAAAIDRASRGSFTSVLSLLIPGMPKSESRLIRSAI